MVEFGVILLSLVTSPIPIGSYETRIDPTFPETFNPDLTQTGHLTPSGTPDCQADDHDAILLAVIHLAAAVLCNICLIMYSFKWLTLYRHDNREAVLYVQINAIN